MIDSNVMMSVFSLTTVNIAYFRCKLFYQKEGAWVEKGVGNLHLKPCGEKTQMVMRADTNLGNI